MRSKRATILSGVVLTLTLVVAFHWNSAQVDPDEARAIAVAKQEVRRKGWKFSRVSQVEKDGEQWRVSLVRFPPTFGGHAIVVTTNGEVAKYIGGK